MPGWDGLIETVEDNAWVPNGISYWELGTSKDPGTKAGSDFEKRLEQIPETDAAGATFVFVTSRRWPGKEAWLENARKRNVWANVLAWDADDLEAWLETSPSTALWLGIHLNIAGHGIEAVERNWVHWSEQSDPHITTAALFSGREESKVALKNRIQQKNTLIPVMADSQSEAIAFVCALLIEEGYSQHAACITSEEGWQFVDANAGIELVVITDNRLGNRRAPREEMSLIVPMAFGDKEFNLAGICGKATEQRIIELRRPKPEEFKKELFELGIEESDATRYTRTLGRSWTVFRRWHAQNPAIKNPGWTVSNNTSSLLALTLVGAWNNASEGDKACISEITNRPYEDIETELLNLLALDDAPVVKIGSLWKAKASLELLHLMAPKLTSAILTRFFNVAIAMFEKPDPVLELEEDKRWMASIYGKVREQSGVVLESMSESIAKLGYFSDNNRHAVLNSHVRSFTRKLLEDASDERWLSISSFLRSFAEAAPDEFLCAVEHSLQRPDKPVTRLITETQHSGTLGRCWHANLLWALELLAWYPTRLGKVANILVDLTNVEIKGNWGNTPFNSLVSLFRPWYPQTAASTGLRLSTIRKIAEKTPSVAWNLLMALLPSHFDMASPNAKPHWRDDDSGVSDSVTYEEIWQLVLPIADLLLEQAQGVATHIAELIPKVNDLDENFRDKVIALATTAKEFKDEDREVVRCAVRQFLSWENSYNQEDSKHDRFLADELRPLFDDLASYDLVLRHTWIFSNDWVTLPDGREDDFEETNKVRASLRSTAVHEIYESSGWQGIERLAKQCGEPRLVGLELINKPFERGNLATWLCQWYLNLQKNSVLDPLTYGVLHALPQEEFGEFLKTCLHSLEKQTQSPEKIAGFMNNAPQSMTLWKLVEVSSSAVIDHFWKMTKPYYVQGTSDHLSFCIEKLLDSDRPKTALEAMGDRAEELSSYTLIRILKEIVGGQEEHSAFPRSWHITRLFKALSKKDCDKSEIISLEFAYYLVLKNDKYGTPHLIEELLSNPESFMELMCIVFKPRHSEREPLAEHLQSVAETAGSLIHDGHGVPGKTSCGEIDRELFFNWVNGVRKLAKEKDREVVTDLTIGAWLSNWPINKDLQCWPEQAIAELLDQDDCEDIRRGFHTGVRNSRGVTSRSPYDGGAQERKVSGEFRNFSSHWESSKPNLTAMIESLAKSFEYEAQRHDEDGLWNQES
ncbi:hypothetical protein [Thalassolituus sp.]|uniref:hypothetical protein n=1 Tax=Thalassolituus sp. TaxID=2030822 RepID=UPI0039822892